MYFFCVNGLRSWINVVCGCYMSILGCKKGVVWVVCIVGVICDGLLAPNLASSSTVFCQGLVSVSK